MQAVDENIDAEVVDQESHKPQDRDPRSPVSSPPGGGSGGQVGGVDHPGDEGPGFLRVPAPVTPPRVLRPDGTGDHGEGPQGKSESDDATGEGLQLLRRRRRRHHALPGQAPLLSPGLHQRQCC